MRTKTRRKKRYLISASAALGLLCLLIFTIDSKLVIAAASDPDFYYYYGERKIALTLSTEKVAVRLKQGLTIEEQKAVVESEQGLGLFSQREEIPTFRLVILPLVKGVTEEYVIQTIQGLNNRAEVEGAFPVFVFSSGEIVSTDEFVVKFGPGVSKEEIDAFNTLNGVEIEDKIEGIEHYTLRVKDPKNINTLKMANLYNENPITIFSVFNYIVRTKDAPRIPDDDYFPEQWYLNNIDAPEGWDINTGSSGIVIAVLDTGVDLGHEDLVNKLVAGYDAFDEDNDPSPGADPNNAHGTACAGLAAAQTNNTIGIAGVSWDCKLMPIRVDHADDNGVFSFPPVSFRRGINWAADNGADVLSCSVPELGDNPDPAVQDAIRYAKNNGREGKGCVVLVAAHNFGRDIRFPAAYPEVIAVGATDENDNRWDWSNFGPELDVMAPSGWGPDEGVIIWTTDISGNAGYNPHAHPPDPGDVDGNYYKWYGGTSAATPEVAGLAGLILSVDSDLTANEVQFIIESTADDQIGDPLEDTEGWDQYYGWGRINVETALLETLDFSDEKLFAWWKFDEGNGQTAEDSAGDNDGTLVGNPTWVSGRTGETNDYALDFNGSNHVSLSPIGALAGDSVTISAWIKAASTLEADKYYPIVAQYTEEGTGYYFSLYGYYPDFYLNDHWITSSVSVNTEDWHHVAGTYNGSHLKIYVDGILRGTLSAPGQSGADDYAYIGFSGGERWFIGKIDDVWVLNYALDPEQECFPILHPDFSEWLFVGKPDCWCEPRQCHGDADDRYQGKQHYWVCTWDLDVLIAAWSKPFEEIEGETIPVGIPPKEVGLICADFKHDAQGKNKYRVSNNDLDILVANWSIPDGPAPDCFDGYLEGQQAGPPVKHHTLEEIVIWLEELWLSDKELRKAIGNRRWKEFLESLIEEWLSE
jgi:subtilisin family serine protease